MIVDKNLFYCVSFLNITKVILIIKLVPEALFS